MHAHAYTIDRCGSTLLFIVTVQFTLNDKEYEGKLSNQAMLQCTVFANIKEKDQYWVGKTTQQFALPDLSFSFPSGSSNAKKGK